ncbi:MAG: YraN family protein [Clostridiales Family XIII bacterium]|nr:YraN family protein [Clostridiales Family XIII bacterium]
MKLGAWGEMRAALYLEKHGFTVLERNYRCRVGEIDIIALKGKVLTFVEVKTRSDFRLALPCESVTEEKRRRIQKAADSYIMESARADGTRETIGFRFDVIEILVLNEKTWLRHMTDAF